MVALRRLCALGALAFIAFVAPAAIATPANNQLLNCGTLASLTSTSGSGTTFKGSVSCGNTSSVVNRAYFVANISNTGSCNSGLSASLYSMTYGDMLNCNSNSGYTPTQQTASISGSGAVTGCQTSAATGTTQTTPSGTVAPTTSTNEIIISWTTSGTGTTTVSLANPSGTTVVAGTTTSPITYYAAGAAAGAYTASFAMSAYGSSLHGPSGEQTCYQNNVGSSYSGSLKWYQ